MSLPLIHFISNFFIIFYSFNFISACHFSVVATNFGSPCWSNDRMQIFGTSTLAYFLEAPSTFVYSQWSVHSEAQYILICDIYSSVLRLYCPICFVLFCYWRTVIVTLLKIHASMGDVRYTAAPGTPLSARLKLPFTFNYLIGLIWTNYSNSRVLSFFSP